MVTANLRGARTWSKLTADLSVSAAVMVCPGSAVMPDIMTVAFVVSSSGL